jgi:hypothetical protein
MLYNILKPLVTREDPVKLYRNVIDEDFNSRPRDFVVYKADITNSARVYGDGKVLIRRCNCDITVNEGGDGNNDSAGYLVNLVEEILQRNNVKYTKVGIGYIPDMDAMQTTFDFYLI